MRANRVFSALVAAAALAGGQKAAARPLTYDCDTGAGNFSLLETSADGPGYRITGRVTPVVLREDRRWAPSATIRIEDAARDGVAIRIGRTRGNRLEIRLATAVGGQRSERVVAMLEAGSARPFDLSLSPEGDAVAMLGETHASARARVGAGAKLSVTCSTGEFLFEHLDFGETAPR